MLKDIKKNIVFIILCFLILILLTVFLYRYNNVLEGLSGNDLKYVKYTPATCSSNIANCPTVEKGFSFNLNSSLRGSNTYFYLLPPQFNPLIKAKLLDTSDTFNSDSNGNLYKIKDSARVFDEQNNPVTFTKIKTGSFLNCLLPFSKESLGNYDGFNPYLKFSYDSNNSKPFTFTINNGAKDAKDLVFDISLNKETIGKINSTFLDLAKKDNSKDENLYFSTFDIKYTPTGDVSGIKIDLSTINKYDKYNISITKKDKSIDTLSNIHESRMLFFISCILNMKLHYKQGTSELDLDKYVSNVNTNYDITLNGLPIPQTQTNYTSGLLSCNTNKYFVIVKNR